jgi:hypothetical protein
MRSPLIRFTLTLEPAEYCLLLALQGSMQADLGKRIPLAEAVRQAVSEAAKARKIKAQ